MRSADGGREHERPHPSIGRDAQPRVT
jgi:hypothetical protein